MRPGGLGAAARATSILPILGDPNSAPGSQPSRTRPKDSKNPTGAFLAICCANAWGVCFLTAASLALRRKLPSAGGR